MTWRGKGSGKAPDRSGNYMKHTTGAVRPTTGL